MSISRLSLFKRSNNFWYILYYEDDRQRWKSTGCSRKIDAYKKLTNFKSGVFCSRTVQKPLARFSEEFLEYARSVYAKGAVDIFAIGLGHLQAIAGNILLSSLSLQHLDRYKRERPKQVKASSVNVELRGLRSIMNIALRWKLRETKPSEQNKVKEGSYL